MSNNTFIFSLLFGLVLGLYMYQDAKKRKLENPSVWIWVGLLFSVLGLITYWYWHMRPPAKKKK